MKLLMLFLLAAVLSARAADAVQQRTHGVKRVLIIRIDYSDLPGTPTNSNGTLITEVYAAGVFNDPHGVREFYEQGSYGKMSLQVRPPLNGDSPDITPVLRMPQPVSFYLQPGNSGLIPTHAREVAGNTGIDISTYDLHAIVSSSLANVSGSTITFGGRADVGGDYVWINGAYNFRVIAHETGHAFGLWHANLWEVKDGNPASRDGISREYGDIFDLMGSGDTFENQFSHFNKYLLGWIALSNITTVKFPGTYRLFRYDHADADLAGTLALKIAAKDGRTYWIGYRGTNELVLVDGAYILKTEDRGDDSSNDFFRSADLIDTRSPGSDVVDAILPAGERFFDAEAGIEIETAGAGGVEAGKYLDIRISMPPDLEPEYLVSTVAGRPRSAGSGDGPAEQAQFYDPAGISFGPGNVLYIADRRNHLIRKLLPNGIVTTLAGRAGVTGSSDGAGTNALFSLPEDIAVTAVGDILVADSGNSTIRKVTPLGEVSTFAGQAGSVGSVDGTRLKARFRNPMGICLDSAGNLFVADAGNHIIRKLTPAGEVTTIAGLAGMAGSSDGQDQAARFNYPWRIACAGDGELYVSDRENSVIRKILPLGVVSTLAGRAGVQGVADGTGSAALFSRPGGLTVGPDGSLYVTDERTIRTVSPGGLVKTIAGADRSTLFAEGPGEQARFFHPSGIALDTAGKLYVADTLNYVIRVITLQVAPLPVLDVSKSGANITLNWPMQAGDYELQQTYDLRDVDWQTTPERAVIINGYSTVAQPVSGRMKFYRLVRR